MSKRVLFIAYYFPPLGGSGVQRSLKFVKYLPKFNFEPIVVTVKEGHNFAYDANMINPFKALPENVSNMEYKLDLFGLPTVDLIMLKKETTSY